MVIPMAFTNNGNNPIPSAQVIKTWIKNEERRTALYNWENKTSFVYQKITRPSRLIWNSDYRGLSNVMQFH
jgi:hypothetical protein